MKCYNCGSEISLGTRRCPSCGMIQPTAAIPHVNVPSARGRGAIGDVQRAVSRSKLPTWVWIAVAGAVLMVAVCGCIGVGVYLYTTGSLPFG